MNPWGDDRKTWTCPECGLVWDRMLQCSHRYNSGDPKFIREPDVTVEEQDGEA